MKTVLKEEAESVEVNLFIYLLNQRFKNCNKNQDI